MSNKQILDKKTIIAKNEEKAFDQKAMGNKLQGPGRHGVYVGSKAKNVKGTIRRIWDYIGKYRLALLLIIITIVLTSGLSILMPWLFAIAIDDYISVFDYQGTYRIAAIIMSVAVATSILRFISQYTMVIISQKTVKQIRKDAFDKLQLLPVKYYDTNQAGDITSKITNDVDLISNSLASVLTQLISSVITLIGALVMMLILNPLLALVVIVFIPIIGVFTMKIGKITKKGFKEQQKHVGLLNGIIEESISGLKVVKLYSQEENIINEFKNRNEQLRASGFRAQVYAGIVMPVVNFFNNFIYLLVVIVGAVFYITKLVVISVGDIYAMTAYARQFIQPIANLAQLFNALQQALAGAERVFALIDEDDEYIHDGDTSREHLSGHVEFEDVSFRYVEDTPVLKHISFDVAHGTTTAIVGPTGSGKTTIINLINRFYDVDEGSIKIDGLDIKSIKKDDLRKHIGVVLQDTNLFSGTVYENIHYGDLTASKEEVIAASKLANADDFIMKLPDGYESEVYEGGQNFSQGERQLISIARTILSNPDILILDEATSNVDTRTEFKIQESMRTLMEGRTSFVIAHRLQTIRSAKQILVINEGMLIEKGNHETLLEQQGFYHSLYTTQFKDLLGEQEEEQVL